jgi:hypothetical protein
MSRAEFENVTFADIEVSAFYVSGQASLIVRSDNGAGPNGWHAYVAVVNPTNITLHTSNDGVLSAAIATFWHATAAGERVQFRAVENLLTVLINGVAVGMLRDNTFANGVVGFGSVSGVSVWDVSLGDFTQITSQLELTYLDEAVIDDIEYGYRIASVDVMNRHSTWSEEVLVTPSSPVMLAPSDTITAALRDFAVQIIGVEFFTNSFSEAIAAALQSLTITVQSIEFVTNTVQETITAALQGLTITPADVTYTAVDNIAETVTASLVTLDVHAHTVEYVDGSTGTAGDTVTVALGSLSITVSAA